MKDKIVIVGGLENSLYVLGGRLPLGIYKDKNKKLYYIEGIKIVKDVFQMQKENYSLLLIAKIIKEKNNYDRKSKEYINEYISDIIKN